MTFPELRMLARRAELTERICPLPDFPVPSMHCSSSKRLRRRWAGRIAIALIANQLLRAINAMYAGRNQMRTQSGKWASDDTTRAAQEKAHQLALREATEWEKGRRCFGTSGALSLSELLKYPSDSYGSKAKCKMVPIRAADLDEPVDTRVVSMLDALSPEESAYYTDESSVLDMVGKSLIF